MINLSTCLQATLHHTRAPKAREAHLKPIAFLRQRKKAAFPSGCSAPLEIYSRIGKFARGEGGRRREEGGERVMVTLMFAGSV